MMILILGTLFLVLSILTNSMASLPTVSELQKQIRSLELRVSKLETDKKVRTKNGLKITNLKGKKIGSSGFATSENEKSIPPGMIDKFKKQLEEYKIKKNETQKYMDELMKEDDERFN
jgi:hypothetical protein